MAFDPKGFGRPDPKGHDRRSRRKGRRTARKRRRAARQAKGFTKQTFQKAQRRERRQARRAGERAKGFTKRTAQRARRRERREDRRELRQFRQAQKRERKQLQRIAKRKTRKRKQRAERRTKRSQREIKDLRRQERQLASIERAVGADLSRSRALGMKGVKKKLPKVEQTERMRRLERRQRRERRQTEHIATALSTRPGVKGQTAPPSALEKAGRAVSRGTEEVAARHGRRSLRLRIKKKRAKRRVRNLERQVGVRDVSQPRNLRAKGHTPRSVKQARAKARTKGHTLKTAVKRKHAARREEIDTAGVARGALERAGLPVGVLEKALPKSAHTAVDVLEETLRPISAIAEASRQRVESARESGRGLFDFDPVGDVEAAARGFTQNKTTFSDVLEEGGVENKALRTGLGLTLDIALDPLTYVTLGISAPAKITRAVKAAEKVADAGGDATAALKAGQIAARDTKALPRVSRKRKSIAAREGARDRAPVAGAQDTVVERLPRGIRVGFGGLKSSGRGSAKFFKKSGLANIARKATDQPGVRELAHVSPHVPPNPRVGTAAWKIYKGGKASARGAGRQMRLRGVEYAEGIGRQLGERSTLTRRVKLAAYSSARQQAKTNPAHNRVRMAMEAEELGSLSGREHMAADWVKEAQDWSLSQVRRAGVLQPRYMPGPGEPTGYVARRNAAEIAARETSERALSRKASARRRQPKPKIYERNIREAWADLPAAVNPFEPRLDKTVLHKLWDDANLAETALSWQAVLQTGRRVGKGQRQFLDEEAEALYKIDPTNPAKGVTEVTDEAKKLDILNGNLPPDGSYHVLPKDIVAWEQIQNATINRGWFERGFVRWTQRLKWILTQPNPQYHMRNLFGDFFNASLEHSVFRLAAGVPAAFKVLRRQAVQGAKRRGTRKNVPAGGFINLKKGRVHVDDLLDEAEKMGVPSGGFTGAEFSSLTRGPLRRINEARENLARVSSYVAGRRRGLTAEQAAERVRWHAIDYNDLSQVERRLFRQIQPFWTWRSRAVVIQAQGLFKRPGRFAGIEKIIQEGAKAAGLPDDWREQLAEGALLGVPMPMFGLGGDEQPFLAYPWLPVTELNLLTLNPDAVFEQVMAGTNPILKTPIEALIKGGYSFFYRDQLEKPYQRMVPAPAWATALPDSLKKLFGIQKGLDKRSGENILMWRGKADYFFRSFPETALLAQLTSTGPSRHGRTWENQLTGWLTGIKTNPFDPGQNKLNQLYEGKEKIQEQLEIERELGKGDSRKAQRLQEKITKIDERIHVVSRQAGYKIPLGREPSGSSSGGLPGLPIPGSSSGSSGGGGGEGLPPIPGSSSGSSSKKKSGGLPPIP